MTTAGRPAAAAPSMPSSSAATTYARIDADTNASPPSRARAPACGSSRRWERSGRRPIFRGLPHDSQPPARLPRRHLRAELAHALDQRLGRELARVAVGATVRPADDAAHVVDRPV